MASAIFAAIGWSVLFWAGTQADCRQDGHSSCSAHDQAADGHGLLQKGRTTKKVAAVKEHLFQEDGEGDAADCPVCCKSSYASLMTTWKTTDDATASHTSPPGHSEWCDKAQASMQGCGAKTTEDVLYGTKTELFIAWALIFANHTADAFCPLACSKKASPLFEEQLEHLEANSAETAQTIASWDHADLVKDKSAALVQESSEVTQQDLIAISDAAENTGGCKIQCYRGSYSGAWGTFCGNTAGSSMSVAGSPAWWTGRSGSCSGITMSPNGKWLEKDGKLSLSGGSGTCKARKDVMEIRCDGNDKMTAVTHCSRHVKAEPGSWLLQEWSKELDMSIDDLLDHAEHGPHAQNMLVDSYKQSLAKGESLLEASRKFTTHQKNQLEERHLRIAIDLHSKLPEYDKKIRTVPVGFSFKLMD